MISTEFLRKYGQKVKVVFVLFNCVTASYGGLHPKRNKIGV